MSNAIIEVHDLTVRYGNTVAVDGTSFEVRQGEVFALLGTNGAGKTTTLDVLEGYLQPSSGAVSVFGLDPSRDRDRLASRMGIMLQEAGFFETLTVRQTITAWRRFYDTPRSLADTVALVGIEHRLGTRVNALSGGERRRLDLGLALLGHPEILFLDEPTTGMDPAGRRDCLELVAGMVTEGLTVVLTTHYLEEAEQLAHRVAIMHRGRIRRMGTLGEVLTGASESTVSFDVPVLLAQRLPSGLDAHTEPRGSTTEITVRTADPEATLRALLGWAESHRTSLDRLQVRRGSLEDVFLGLSDDDLPASGDGPARTSDPIPMGA